jgi:hypothetical protein
MAGWPNKGRGALAHGDLCESIAATWFVKNGVSLAWAQGHNTPWDFIVDALGTRGAVRVQVKSMHSNEGRAGYDWSRVDLLVLVDEENDELYGLLPKGQRHLRSAKAHHLLKNVWQGLSNTNERENT